jgi:hypothetical protein
LIVVAEHFSRKCAFFLHIKYIVEFKHWDATEQKGWRTFLTARVIAVGAGVRGIPRKRAGD